MSSMPRTVRRKVYRTHTTLLFTTFPRSLLRRALAPALEQGQLDRAALSLLVKPGARHACLLQQDRLELRTTELFFRLLNRIACSCRPVPKAQIGRHDAVIRIIVIPTASVLVVQVFSI